jgi:hypothetical protein
MLRRYWTIACQAYALKTQCTTLTTDSVFAHPLGERRGIGYPFWVPLCLR